ncbi:MAG: peptidoglycan bridge formation glycyltransferase FemA/FemB family protein [Candidatus Wildermuthbacteria bacterium]|nr:peptidoglycan bridge formation glycyltransferase FemA/FemB family protein [Candidatus Wildermuthbacteria bacterium]
MEIREITNKNVWEEFLDGCAEKTFLQSWNWGEFQKRMGGRVWRLGVFDKKQLIAVAFTVKVAARRGTFLLVPHGPVTPYAIPNGKHEVLEALLAKLREIAKEERATFIRINPIWERNTEDTETFSRFGFRKAPIQMHPEASWKLDLIPSEHDLLSGMRKTTRYLVNKVSERSGIHLIQSSESSDVELFSQMHQEVSQRQRFVPFSFEYLKNEFEVFADDSEAVLFFGNYEGKIVAASFVVFWSKIGFYHHAASLHEYSKLSIPYLLQWEAIKEAKRRGCVLYDFWGYVNPHTQNLHPWAGPTLFKMGFGGRAYEYIKTQDFPLSWKYWPTFFFEKMRKFQRHL